MGVGGGEILYVTVNDAKGHKSQIWSSSETQGLPAGTMQYFWAGDIFVQKFISRAEEHPGTHPH